MSGIPALLDVEVLRALAEPTAFEPIPASETIVLGSRQQRGDLIDGLLEDGSVALRRRRGGGGAVLLRPGDVWCELWLPAGTGPSGSDVRATACTVGGWWQEALRQAGVSTTLHRSGVERASQGSIACFAGLGPGELCAGNRKLLGLSQWRCRQGVLVSCVIGAAAPRDLAGHLADPSLTPALTDSTSLGEVAPSLRAGEVLDAVADVAVSSIGMLVRVSDLPSH